MKFKEITRKDDDVHNDITDIINKQPSVGGSGSNTSWGITKKVTYMYPANRMNFFESVTMGETFTTDSIYQDNMIFTAYDIQGRRRSDMGFGSTLGGLTGAILGGKDNYGLNANTVANILMPRSITDVDEHKHEFVTAQDSLLSRGDDSVGNAIGSGLSTMVAEVFDNVTKGYFADQGEAIGTPTRATYKGADHRVKTFKWKLSPRNPEDLLSLLKIYKTFAVLSYGEGSNSSSVEAGSDYLQSVVEDWIKKEGGVFKPGSQDVNMTSTQILEAFKYVKVMSNPTLWYIRYYEPSGSMVRNTNVFGPANITNIKFNHTPDGKFQGLARAPNQSSSFELEITFREAISHTRNTIGYFI